ncbi:transposase mutator type [Lucifera butyrica]|uniref:Mutator family transposase n=1 Tax=Lucifera butyrica TaxID=1351585 RepID=A0A498R570_9FIRM|nr:transposase mutator type [Lucifera butyrica]
MSTFYAYPPAIRKIICTTNIIEGLHRQFRKVTKTKAVFPNDDALRKMLYLASNNIVRPNETGGILSHVQICTECNTAYYSAAKNTDALCQKCDGKLVLDVSEHCQDQNAKMNGQIIQKINEGHY